jgi:hypothetical protein
MNGKALRLICGGCITVLKAHNIASRHYNLKQKEKYRNCTNALRRQKVVTLKRELESRQNVIRKQSSHSSSALRVSYRVAHLLTKESKPFCNHEIRKKMFSTHSATELLRKKKEVVFSIVSLSPCNNNAKN